MNTREGFYPVEYILFNLCWLFMWIDHDYPACPGLYSGKRVFKDGSG